MRKIISQDPKQLTRQMGIKRKIHEIIAPTLMSPKAYLDKIASKRYGIHAGFAKNVGDKQHIIVVLKNIPEFVDDIGLREYFSFQNVDLIIRKPISSRLQLNQKMDDLYERLGGKTTVLFGGFRPKIRRPKLYITKLIREGIDAKNFKNMILDSSTSLEVFCEVLGNYDKYMRQIRLLRKLKNLGEVQSDWGELDSKAERI